MNSKTSFITLLFLSAIVAGCSNGKPKDFDYGNVENGKYVNSYFDMEMSIPENWIVMSQKNLDELMKQSGEIVAGDNKRMKAALKAAEIKTANLLLASEYEIGSVEVNSNISVTAENIKLASGFIKNGSDYLKQTIKMLEQTQVPYEAVGDITTEIINNQEFAVMNGIIFDFVNQKMYVILKNEFALIFTITYFDDEQKEVLENAVNSVKFK